MSKREIWENRTKSTFWVEKSNVKGDLELIRVHPGGKIDITSEDRRLNEEKAVSRDGNWFANGALSPAFLVEDAEDYAEVRSNPNVLSEAEIKDLLKLTAPKLKEALAEIDSPLVLQTLVDIIEAGDVDVSHAKAKAVKVRHDELNPQRTKVKVSQTIDELTSVENAISE